MSEENLRQLRIVRNELLCKRMRYFTRGCECLREAAKPEIPRQKKEELKLLVRHYFFIASDFQELFDLIDKTIQNIEESISNGKHS
ncbi:hypothetical protein DW106_08290 [Ruminococcus sp. AM09-18-1]|jgi:hypothetical protein|nr:hypothetical protein DW106_08290 [Ruminococcus sp. AM09-18-1]DAO17862.1 MAG TPA: hypothetical protein [Caudoviricetes sp.]